MPPSRHRRGWFVGATVITPILSHSDQRDVIPPCPRGEQRQNTKRQSHTMHGTERSLLNLRLQTHLASKATYLIPRTGTGGGIPHRANTPSRLHAFTPFVNRRGKPLASRKPKPE